MLVEKAKAGTCPSLSCFLRKTSRCIQRTHERSQERSIGTQKATTLEKTKGGVSFKVNMHEG